MPLPSRKNLVPYLKHSLIELCNIPSPSHGEAAIAHHTVTQLKKLSPALKILRHNNSFIVDPPPARTKKSHPHIAIVGHLDVVPQHSLACHKNGRIYGAGASDMKAGLAAMLAIIHHSHATTPPPPYHLSFIFYSTEEVPLLPDNGLYQLIKTFPQYFKSIDLAIVAEPTDNTLQLGCAGSLHAQVEFRGKEAHSARPWHGSNALSRASRFISYIAKIKPKRQRLWGVDFYDVINITESQAQNGKTTLPAWWRANVNFRFSPHFTLAAAKSYFKELLRRAGATQPNSARFNIYSAAPAGYFYPTPLFSTIEKRLNLHRHAKQAWTDVAQLSALKIPAFNYGPGLTAQCHRPNEYASLPALVRYTQNLYNALVLH